MGFDFVTRYEGIDFDPRKMWFLPLKNASRLQDLGLKIAIPNFRPKKAREAFNAVEIILETALGERVAAEKIQHLEVVSLPSSPAEEGFLKLPELSDYIVWHNKQSASTND